MKVSGAVEKMSARFQSGSKWTVQVTVCMLMSLLHHFPKFQLDRFFAKLGSPQEFNNAPMAVQYGFISDLDNYSFLKNLR